MARTFTQPGKVIQHTAAAALSAGDVVIVGNLVGVALVDMAIGETGSVSISGVHTLPKVTGTAWTQGAVLDWDDSLGAFATTIVTPAAGDLEGGAIAAADAASAAAVGEVLLVPNPSATAT